VIYLVKATSTPLVWVLVLLALGLVFLRWPGKKHKCRLGIALIILAGVVLYLLSIEPVANGLAYPLEADCAEPSPQAVADLDVVVVLGGGSYISGYESPHRVMSSHSLARLCKGISVFTQSKAGTIVFCGTTAMKPVAIELGITESQIIEEPNSSNTFENAAELARLIPPDETTRIGVVTSAAHMPRAVAAFHRHFPGDAIVPIPTDYLRAYTGGIRSVIPSASNLDRSTKAIHEWIGIFWYRIRY